MKALRDALALLCGVGRGCLARQDDAPLVGRGGKLEPEHRIAAHLPVSTRSKPSSRPSARAEAAVTHDRGPRFAPAESDEPARRIRRLEDWAGRHDQWSAQTAVEGHEKVVRVEERVTVLERKVTRLFASIGEHRLKWAIVAWVVGTAAAAGIAIYAR